MSGDLHTTLLEMMETGRIVTIDLSLSNSHDLYLFVQKLGEHIPQFNARTRIELVQKQNIDIADVRANMKPTQYHTYHDKDGLKNYFRRVFGIIFKKENLFRRGQKFSLSKTDDIQILPAMQNVKLERFSMSLGMYNNFDPTYPKINVISIFYYYDALKDTLFIIGR